MRPAKASISRESSFNLFTTEDYVKVSHPNYKSQVIDVKKQKSVRLEPLLFLNLEQDKTFYVNDIPIHFQAIPEAMFMMGSIKEKREQPVHKVYINPFRIMEHEMTWEIYQICIAENVCPENEMNINETKKHPVHSVSWEQITNVFIPWFNRKTRSKFRLPSEAEWEYVAKANSNTQFSWGEDVGVNNANCWGCNSKWDYKITAPVKSFTANKFGVYDMHGNLWEWVADCFSSYEHSPRDAYPQQDIGCDRRVLRGGSYKFKPTYMSTSFRGRDKPMIKSNGDGFRLAQG